MHWVASLQEWCGEMIGRGAGGTGSGGADPWEQMEIEGGAADGIIRRRKLVRNAASAPAVGVHSTVRPVTSLLAVREIDVANSH